MKKISIFIILIVSLLISFDVRAEDFPEFVNTSCASSIVTIKWENPPYSDYVLRYSYGVVYLVDENGFAYSTGAAYWTELNPSLNEHWWYAIVNTSYRSEWVIYGWIVVNGLNQHYIFPVEYLCNQVYLPDVYLKGY